MNSIILHFDRFREKDTDLAKTVFDIIITTAIESSKECDNAVEVSNSINEKYMEVVLKLDEGLKRHKIYLSYVRDMCAKSISLISDPDSKPTEKKADVLKMFGATAGGKKFFRLYKNEESNYIFFGIGIDNKVRPLIEILETEV
jgi:hypothetical protein